MNIIKKYISFILAFALIFSYQLTPVKAETSDVSGYKAAYGTNLVKASSTSLQTTFQAKYDPRNLGIMTSVKNQGVDGVCWSFAGLATLESFLKLKGYGDYDLSEEHVMWTETQNSSGNGWVRQYNDGGYMQMVPGYLVSGLGPKLESEIPYNQTARPSNMDTAKTIFDVSSIEYLPDDMNQIKQDILSEGAVASSYYYSKYYNSIDGKSYYCNNTYENNHGITIVGWDDNYSKDNFTGAVKPSLNGAWLVKNSWGTGTGENGYNWISYQDSNLLKTGNGLLNYSIKSLAPHSPNRYIYQLDKYGAVGDFALTDSTGTAPSKIMYANIFDFTSQNNNLSSVIFESASKGTNYTVYYTSLVNGVPVMTTNRMHVLASGTVPYEGYINVDINNYTVPAGKGAIVIYLNDQTLNGNTVIGGEMNMQLSDGTSGYISDAKQGESFIKVNNTTTDVNSGQFGDIKVDFSIKAVTTKSVSTTSDNTATATVATVTQQSNDTTKQVATVTAQSGSDQTQSTVTNGTVTTQTVAGSSTATTTQATVFQGGAEAKTGDSNNIAIYIIIIAISLAGAGTFRMVKRSR